ncbi:tetraacyldisaccharide 4'-kinase [Rhizobiales bacterium]|uniref:tetraacyldisaccharide 4'-kinase n=1 Tax=Hongsoonwoonella zoysiae TaxID=2821844 RepID=UPI001560F6D3|nr:tetraacyldisaccharide 4'-kinase [Hongsoonwoonella zoysiae]NRG19810.1 tetraacyldisaccharide 4'-kinase [Hongsoonwoonella zoysiae]
MIWGFGKAPFFWWRPRPDWRALLLWPLGAIYGAVTARRMQRRPDGSVSVPVVCIGNFVAGGVGKTPFSLALAAELAGRGYSPVFLLRGYGGKAKGPVLVDRKSHSALDVGDEALLLAKDWPTVVSRDRLAGGQFAASHGDIVIMDDGFQNPRLQKDFSIVLVDAQTGTGNGFCLPAGPLRAPLRRQIVAASALAVIGEGEAAKPAVRLASRKGLPLFHARLETTPDPELAGARVLAFAGIGRPEKFFASLRELGAEIAIEKPFPDHHPYSYSEAEALLTEADDKGLLLVTTAKDMVRIQSLTGEFPRWLAGRARVVDVNMRIEEAERLCERIGEAARSKALKVAGAGVRRFDGTPDNA